MSLALSPPPTAAPARAGVRLGRVSLGAGDLLTLAGLLATLLALLVWRADRAPLQLWDESRNANNALEIAVHGHWLVPTFGGRPDHWNTKPPLLIWAMAAGLKLGLPPLVALRLPSFLAALGALGMIWGVLRLALKDRWAAAIGGALLLSSWVYVGPHAARTGDFDALETLFVTGYVLGFWAAFQGARPRLRFVAATGACLFLAVMTKGVAGVLAAPGLLAFAATRPHRALALARDWRVWVVAGASIGACLGYYALREACDPGYVQAVLANEVGGRFMTVSDNHKGGALYYIAVLLTGFEPGCLLLAASAVSLAAPAGRRRDLTLATLLGGGSLLVVLSLARSKLDWYATPMIPLFALAAAVGTSDALAWTARRRPGWAQPIRIALAAGLCGACLAAICVNRAMTTTSHGDLAPPQSGYGRFLGRIEAGGVASQVTAVDGGFYNDAGFQAYNPMLKFYADPAMRRGLRVEVRGADEDLPPGTEVVSCDPSMLRQLQDDYRLAPRLADRGCVLARIIADR